MQELWSTNQQDIYRELKKLTAERPLISLHDQEGHVGASRLQAMVHRDGRTYLVLQRPRTLSEAKRVSKVVYKLLDKPFIYFPVAVEKANDRFLSCVMPRQLYYLQRRRFPRYRIKNRGGAAFFLNRRARVCQMDLLDLSLGGAKLVGAPRYDLHTSEKIGPATFTIVSEDELVVREVNITEGTIVRSVVNKGALWDVGVRFQMDSAERSALADVLSDSFAKLIFQ